MKTSTGGISTANQEASARATDAERQDDERYANDFNVLVALFRTDIAGKPVDRVTVASQCRLLASLLLDGWGSPDALFPQQCFDDHGPAILLRALAKAYEQPAHVVSDIVEHE